MEIFKIIIEDLLAVLHYLVWGLEVGIPLALVTAFIRWRRAKKTGEPVVPIAMKHRVLHFFYWVYVGVILAITFLSRESGSVSGVDLGLFSTWGINDRNNAFVIENILLFIPYGMLAKWSFRRFNKWYQCALSGVLFSFSIEYLQLLTHRGFFQLDDIITNGIGTLVGVGIAGVILLCRKKQTVIS